MFLTLLLVVALYAVFVAATSQAKFAREHWAPHFVARWYAMICDRFGALMGISSSCNADQNGTTMVGAATHAIRFAVTDADHCDFESPTDFLCTGFCSNSSSTRSDAEIQDVIKTLSTAWLRWHTALEPAASRWWDASDDVLTDYLTTGALSPL